MASLSLLLPLLLAAVGACSAASPVVQLDAWGPNAIRVRIGPPGGAIVEPALGALVPPASPGPSSPSALTNGNLAVTVDAATGFISATRVSDGVGLLKTSWLRFGPPALGSRPGYVYASITFDVPGANKLYGLGEHRTGVLDMTGYSKFMQDSQYYPDSTGADIFIPFFMAHPLGLGFLWNLPCYGIVDLGAGTPGVHNWTAFATGNIDFWLTTTPAPAEGVLAPADPAASGPLAHLLASYTDAVGHAAPMPTFVAGFWQCKNRYRNQSQLMEVAQGYVSRGLPLDIITIDAGHWVNFGDWSFNRACWPDPGGMVSSLRALGVEPAVTFWPMVTPQGSWWPSFNASGYFVRNRTTGAQTSLEWNAYLVDQTSPATREAVYGAWKQGYGQYGFRIAWLDAAEPERNGAYNFGEIRMEGGTDNEVGEAWVQQHVRALHDGFVADGLAPNEFFMLPRSTWAGLSKYSAGVWSGDIESSFAELALQVRVAQGMGLSGHALWTNDGGGYKGGDPANPTFQQLIVRWLQASAFFPIMRLHGKREGGPPEDACGVTGGDNEIWTLAADGAHYDAMAAVLLLRSSLKPYTLAINAITVATGLPMVRAMVLAFPDDPGCAGTDVEGQWMYGPDWLVSPVTVENATVWTVYLPPLSNASWVYHWNGTDVGHGGGAVVVATSNITHYPLFRRSPPLIPTSAPWESL